MHFVQWFDYWAGLTDAADRPYLFWSGIGSDIGEITLLGAIIAAYRHKNCNVKGCWRIGHIDPEHGHPACRKHHSLRHKL